MKATQVIDYTEVIAVPDRLTVALVNTYCATMVDMANKFAHVTEKRLLEVSAMLDRTHIALSLLEAKLKSIPDSAFSSAATSDASAPPLPPGAPVSSPGAPDAAPLPPAPAEEEKGSGMSVKEDPRYAKYFKMIDYGVPLSRVQTEMMMHGLDATLLSTPDAPSDFKPSEKSESESESEEESEEEAQTESEDEDEDEYEDEWSDED